MQWRDLSSLQHLPPGVLSDSPASASQVAGIAVAHHHAQLIFIFLVEMGFHQVSQAGLELLISSDLPASASQNAGITGREPLRLARSHGTIASSVMLMGREAQSCADISGGLIWLGGWGCSAGG